MCFYESLKYEGCECSEWGDLVQHCAKEYCTGEKCWTRFESDTIRQPRKCSTCMNFTKFNCDLNAPRPSSRLPQSCSDDWGLFPAKKEEDTRQMLRRALGSLDIRRGIDSFLTPELVQSLGNNIGLQTIEEVFKRVAHRSIYSGDNYECLCGKQFNSSDAFLRHIHGHVKPYVCLICDAPKRACNYGRIADCLKHIQVQHNFNYVQVKGLRTENSWWKTEPLDVQASRLRTFAAAFAKPYDQVTLPPRDEPSPTRTDDIDLSTFTLSLSESRLTTLPASSDTYDSEGGLHADSLDNRDLGADAMIYEYNLGEEYERTLHLADDEDPTLSQLGFDPLVASISSSLQQLSHEFGHAEISSPSFSEEPPDFQDIILELEQESVQDRFDRASEAAYAKLLAAAPSCSLAFQNFLNQLGSHDDLVVRGFTCFDQYLNHETLSSLEDVYSFLHIAFAISQTELTTPASSTSEEFYYNIHTLRDCLSDVEMPMEADGQEFVYIEKLIFDEIVDVMQDEIDYAIAWLGENTDGLFMVTMRSKMERLQEARNMLKAVLDGSHPTSAATDFSGDGPRGGSSGGDITSSMGDDAVGTLDPNDEGTSPVRVEPQLRLPPDKPSWLDIVTGSVFLVIVGFLQAVRERGEAFQCTSHAPYSFLCDPNLEPKAGDHILPQQRDYMVKKREEFVAVVDDRIVGLLPPVCDKLTALVGAGAWLLRKGVLNTIGHFEHYVLEFGKLLYESSLHKLQFLGSFLESSWSCSQFIGETMPYRVSCSYATGNPSNHSYRPVSPDTQDSSVATLDNSVCYSDQMIDETFSSSNTEEGIFSSTGSSEAMTSLFSPSFAAEESPGTSASLDPGTCHHLSPGPSELMDLDAEEPNEPGTFACTLSGCNNRVFSLNCNLLRHQRDCHPELGRRNTFSCGEANCTFKSIRRGNIERHRWRVHKIPTTKAPKAPKAASGKGRGKD